MSRQVSLAPGWDYSVLSFQVNSSAFSPDGQRLLTASEDGYVYGWETQSGRLLWRLGGHTGGAPEAGCGDQGPWACLAFCRAYHSDI